VACAKIPRPRLIDRNIPEDGRYSSLEPTYHLKFQPNFRYRCHREIKIYTRRDALARLPCHSSLASATEEGKLTAKAAITRLRVAFCGGRLLPVYFMCLGRFAERARSLACKDACRAPRWMDACRARHGTLVGMLKKVGLRKYMGECCCRFSSFCLLPNRLLSRVARDLVLLTF
jgi:hypothetical protein